MHKSSVMQGIFIKPDQFYPMWLSGLLLALLLMLVTPFTQASGFSITDTSGKTHTLAGYKGKWVLVNFWATWCPYCRKEKPVIDEFWTDYRARGFEVIAISIDDSPAQIAAWARETGYAFMAAPTNTSVGAAFGGISSVPTSFILDRDGHIRHKIAGQLHYARLKALVEPLLPKNASPHPQADRHP